LSFNKRENFHLLCQFNIEFYELIEAFKGERSVATLLHVKDANVENDEVHGLILTMPKTQDENKNFQDLIINNHGNNLGTRYTTFINLFDQETKLLPTLKKTPIF
jgi:hypothetical protein